MNEKYGSAPIVFTDENKRKEWENMDESVKKGVYSHLHGIMDKIKHDHSIELLTNVIIDLHKRIEILEEFKSKFKTTHEMDA